MCFLLLILSICLYIKAGPAYQVVGQHVSAVDQNLDLPIICVMCDVTAGKPELANHNAKTSGSPSSGGL